MGEETQREMGREIKGQVESRNVKVQQEERYERIQSSRWNRWYMEVRTIGLLKNIIFEGKRKRGKDN